MERFPRNKSQQRVGYQRAGRIYDKNIESETQQDSLASENTSDEIVGGCRRKYRRDWHRSHPRLQQLEGDVQNYNRQSCQKLHDQEDLETSIKILETVNNSLQEHNIDLGEANEMMHSNLKETINKIEKEKETLQRKNKNLYKCINHLSKTINFLMEQNRRLQESKSSLEDTIKLILEANYDTGRVDETSQQEKASEGTIRYLKRENERLQDYASTLEKNIQEITEGLDESNENIIHCEEIIEELKISESAHEDTVSALLKASENQQENEASLRLTIKELEKEQAMHEEIMRNTENTVKMLMEENHRYQNNEAALQEVARKCTEDNEKYRDSHLCIICLNEETQILFCPCRHLLTCPNCSKSLIHCPLCRQKIEEKLQVYKQ